jgi:hypothetical protein
MSKYLESISAHRASKTQCHNTQLVLVDVSMWFQLRSLLGGEPLSELNLISPHLSPDHLQ